MEVPEFLSEGLLNTAEMSDMFARNVNIFWANLD